MIVVQGGFHGKPKRQKIFKGGKGVDIKDTIIPPILILEIESHISTASPSHSLLTNLVSRGVLGDNFGTCQTLADVVYYFNCAKVFS